MKHKKLIMLSAVMAAALSAQAGSVLLYEDWNWNVSGDSDSPGVITGHDEWSLDNSCFGSGIYVDAYGTFSWETYASGYSNESGEYSLLRFEGNNTSDTWWAGTSLFTTETFSASLDKVLVVDAMRYSLTKEGRARSGLWLMAPDKSKYFIFSDNSGEGGWEYNAYSGLASDNPVGNGSDIGNFSAYNDSTEPHGVYNMRIISNGEEAQLYLKKEVDEYDEEGNLIENNWVYGTTVPLNFDEEITVGVGVYARAPKTEGYEGDYVEATFGPVTITQYDAAYFTDTNVGVLLGETSDEIVVKVPESATASQSINITVATSSSEIAEIQDATDGSLVLTFAVGETEKSFKVDGKASGSATLTLLVPDGMMTSNSAIVEVSGQAGVVFRDDFSDEGTIENNWTFTDQAFEDGTGELNLSVMDGVLTADGSCTVRAWSGGGVRANKTFTATSSLPLHVKVDRTSLTYTDRGRSGIMLCNADRSDYIFFNDSPAENGWVYNIPGVAGSDGNTAGKGRGVDISAFGSMSDGGNHTMEIFYDSSTVQFYLDGVLGATSTWNHTGEIYLELCWFARIEKATVQGGFDNVFVENQIAKGTVSPSSINAFSDIDNIVTVTLPGYAAIAGDTVVTLTSADPSIAYVEGAVDGVATLHFEKGGDVSKRINIITTGVRGETTITLEAQGDATSCLSFASPINVTAFNEFTILNSDDFSGDLSQWELIEWNGSGVLDTKTFQVEEGEMVGYIHSASGTNAGCIMQLQDRFFPSTETPIVFECDLGPLGGRGNQFNANVCVVDLETGSMKSLGFIKGDLRGWYWFSNSLTDTAGSIAPFQVDEFSDNSTHTVKLVCDGLTVECYLDGLYGGTSTFESRQITFALGTGVQHAQNEASVSFDNVVVSGTPSIATDADEITIEESSGYINVQLSDFAKASGATLKLEIADSSIVEFDTGAIKEIDLSSVTDDTLSIVIHKRGVGSTQIQLTCGEITVNPDLVSITALSDTTTLFEDDFSEGAMNTDDWYLSTRSFEYSKTPEAGGTLNTYTGTSLYLYLNMETNYWGGASYITVPGFKVSALSPLVFTVNRIQFSYSGTGSRCSFLVYEGDGSSRWINFADAFGTNAKRVGWSYNRYIGEDGDNATGDGIAFASLNTTEFLDAQAHTVRIELNGETASFYVDNILGGSIAFPVTEDIHFGLGLFGRAEGDNVEAEFGTVTITGSSDPLPNPPVITTQPQALTVAEGESASFSVEASGENLSYQWYKDGVSIEDATAATYQIASVSASEVGSYYVVVKNGSGSVTSDQVLLSLNATEAPELTFGIQDGTLVLNWTEASGALLYTSEALDGPWTAVEATAVDGIYNYSVINAGENSRFYRLVVGSIE